MMLKVGLRQLKLAVKNADVVDSFCFSFLRVSEYFHWCPAVQPRFPPSDVMLQTESRMICVLLPCFMSSRLHQEGRCCVRQLRRRRQGNTRRAAFYFCCSLCCSVCWLFLSCWICIRVILFLALSKFVPLLCVKTSLHYGAVSSV